MNKINILLISDIHLKIFQIDLIKNFCLKNNIQYDFVFYMGDFDSLKLNEQTNIKLINNSIENIKEILNSLEEKICKNLYYVSGNHDPIFFCNNNIIDITSFAKNVHKKIYHLKDNIYITGIGGAIPSFKSKKEYYYHSFKFKEKDYKKIEFKGFPYTNDNDNINYKQSDLIYLNDIKDIFNEWEKNYNNNNNKLIFLSHSGPIFSETANSLKKKKKKVEYKGSEQLQFILNKNKENVMLNIHGHCHRFKGVTNINGIYVINPGALKKGNFCELMLVKNEKWKVKKIEFKNIENYNFNK